VNIFGGNALICAASCDAHQRKRAIIYRPRRASRTHTARRRGTIRNRSESSAHALDISFRWRTNIFGAAAHHKAALPRRNLRAGNAHSSIKRSGISSLMAAKAPQLMAPASWRGALAHIKYQNIGGESAAHRGICNEENIGITASRRR